MSGTSTDGAKSAQAGQVNEIGDIVSDRQREIQNAEYAWERRTLQSSAPSNNWTQYERRQQDEKDEALSAIP